MHHFIPSLFSLCLASLSLIGCSFILDFDKLQSGFETDAGVDKPPPPDDVPGPGPGVDAGQGTCKEPCDDGDPCTTDLCRRGECRNEAKKCTPSSICMTSECVDGQCQETPVVGLILDDYDEAISADEILRSELVGVGDRFYRATFGTFNGERNVELATFDSKSSETLAKVPMSELLEAETVELELGSPVSLVPDSRLGQTLNAYLALKTQNKQAGDLVRLGLNRKLEPKDTGNPVIAAPSNFRFAPSERVGPSGGQLLDGTPFVVWVGAGLARSGVYLQSGEEPADTSLPTFPATTADISAISAIHSQERPGAVWMTTSADGVDLEVALDGADAVVPTPLVQCHRKPEFIGYFLDVSQSIADIWTVTWTTRNGPNYVTEISALQCKDSGCINLTSLAPGQSCSATQFNERVREGVRSQLMRTMRRQGDADNVIYQAQLRAGKKPDREESELSLVLARIEYDLTDDSPEPPTVVGALALDTTTPAETPSWPALALLPPNKIAVSWIKPGSDGEGDTLRVQRHHICFPD